MLGSLGGELDLLLQACFRLLQHLKLLGWRLLLGQHDRRGWLDRLSRGQLGWESGGECEWRHDGKSKEHWRFTVSV